MSIQVLKMNRELLSQIESLLSASAGYPTSIQDELEYFDSEPALSWFVAIDVKSRRRSDCGHKTLRNFWLC